MPSSMCWPAGENCQRRSRNALLVEQVGHRFAWRTGRAVHPGAEIGRHRDVGRGGDDAAASRSSLLAISSGSGRRPCWSTSRLPDELRAVVGTAMAGAGRAPSARTARRRGSARVGGGMRQPLERSHSWPGRTPIAARRPPSARVIRPAWLSLWPGERQAPALDRIGDEADRPVGRMCASKARAGGQVVAAEIGHQRGQFGVAAPLDQRETSPWSPRSSLSRLRQAAPPWKVSAE
jgi:hypothetical protein